MKRILYLSLILMLSTASLAQGQGFDFKGLPLGSTVVDVKAKFPEYYCSKSTAGSPLSDTSCNLSPEMKCLMEQAPHPDNRSCREAVMKAMTYAGVRSDISLMFYDDKLGMARATFSADSFSNVVASMREKYGEPTTKKAEPVTNRMGATFENQILEWKKSGTTIQAEKYANRADRSSVKIFEDGYIAEFEKRRGAKAQQGAKDL